MSAGDSTRFGSRQKSGIRYHHRTGRNHKGDVVEGGVKQAVPSDPAFGFTDARAVPAQSSELPELPIPGRGDAYDECGDPMPLKVCSDCGSAYWGGRTCYRATCPRCWKGWDKRAAVKVSSKLEGRRRYEESKTDGWSGYKFHHVAVSPPPGYSIGGEDALRRTFDLVKEIMQELGADEGFIGYHPWRIKKEYIEDGWQWKDVLDAEDWQDYVYYAPHFHVITLSKFVTGGDLTKGLEERSGWVVERITKTHESNVSIYDLEDLVAATSYTLSHTGIGEDQAAYRYYGKTHNFTPSDHIVDEVEDVFTQVAPQTLGQKFPGSKCGDAFTYRPQTPPSTSSDQDEPGAGELPDEKKDLELVEDGDASDGADGPDEAVDECEGSMVKTRDALEMWLQGELVDNPEAVRALGFYVLTK